MEPCATITERKLFAIQFTILAALFGWGVLDVAGLLPPLEFWISFKAVLFISCLVFGTIGVFAGVSIMKLSRTYAWALVFSGTIYVGMQLFDLAKAAFEKSNFCYFEAVLDQPKAGGGFEWRLHNRQHRLLPFQTMCRYQGREETFVAPCWQAGACLPESINQTTAGEKPIGMGMHKFIWHADNSWKQTLNIFISEKGTLTQTGILFRDGKEIWRFGDEPR